MADLVEVEVALLEGEALNWAVAKAEGLYAFVADPVYMNPHRVFVARQHAQPLRYQPCEDWAIGGPLIHKYGCDLNCIAAANAWEASCWDDALPCPWLHNEEGQSPLIAACRAIVRAKLGKIVQIPRELLP